MLGCHSVPQPHAPTLESSFRLEKLTQMDQAVAGAIQDKKCPGGVLWLEHQGVSYHKAYGQRSVVPRAEAMTEDTVFDAASLTKVVATTPAVMLLIERGAVRLDAPVITYIPEFKDGGKERITMRHLMTHTSGLRPGIETRSGWSGQQAAIQKACSEKPLTEPGSAFRYSDINFIVLGEVIQRVTRKPLELFVQQEVFAPLKMSDSGFLPPISKLGRIAPTEVVEGSPLRGVVHDPTSRKMGGVAGHAGLFTTAKDLARYCRMYLNGGELDGRRIFKPETVRLMTSVQTPEGVARRGLGWDIDSGYSGPRGKVMPVGSFGHTGWTGTSLWVDPFSRTFIIFLSNRNHPDETGSVLALRAVLGTLAGEAVRDYNFSYVPGALPGSTNAARPGARPLAALNTLNGIDVLKNRNFAPIKGLKLGLITNHTGEDRERNPTIDLLWKAPGVDLKSLFSPEHGLRGEADETVKDGMDAQTGLPVYSLYGANRKPTREQLRNLDALVFDIQDIGCRFYTYTATMALAMEACAENGKKFFVLDRINPINGAMVEGPVLGDRPTFVGYHHVPLRYGMTMGELARMFNDERGLKADLTVIPAENWRREMWQDETGLPWTNPSPNMRNLKQAILYPGVGLLESAISVGRGTDTPFEIIGAPYVDDLKLAREMNKARLPGVRFVPIRFTPSASIFKGKPCKGVYLLLTDREACRVVDIGIVAAKVMQRLYPAEFQLDKIKHLLLDPTTLDAIRGDKSIDDIHGMWRKDLDAFAQTRAKYLLY